MKQFVINTKKGIVTFNFPTSLTEITPSYLEGVTSNINVADHHVLVGMVYHNTLPNVIMIGKNRKKTENFGVNVIYVKSGEENVSFIKNIKVGNRLLIDNSQLSLGHHVAAPANKLTLNNFTNILANSTENDLYQKAIADSDNREVMFIEFKIVPASAIVAEYTNDKVEVENNFVEIKEIGEGV